MDRMVVFFVFCVIIFYENIIKSVLHKYYGMMILAPSPLQLCSQSHIRSFVYQGRSTDADMGGGANIDLSQLSGQGRALQVRSTPGGFYGMPPMKFIKI